MALPEEAAVSEEQRASRRAPIRLRIDYERMNAFFADYTKNISRGGTFIKTSRPLDIGTRFVFALSVPALAEPVQLDGEVTWVLPPEAAAQQNDEPGMGIRFIFKDDAERLRFEALVEKLMEESLGFDLAQGLLHGR
jgi:type IV pilus assembly protein PilZ